MEKARFFIQNINIIKEKEDIDLQNCPASIKRRLSEADKISFTLMEKAYIDDIEEIVSTSEYGEFERLKNIIEQYNSFNEVSPTQFSGSVHNFSVGAFCMVKKTNISYTALSADKNSISTGLIKAILSGKKTLFCYFDYFENYKGISFIISKNASDNAIECTIEDTKQEDGNEFKDLINFLENKTNDFKTALFKIKRVIK